VKAVGLSVPQPVKLLLKGPLPLLKLSQEQVKLALSRLPAHPEWELVLKTKIALVNGLLALLIVKMLLLEPGIKLKLNLVLVHPAQPPKTARLVLEVAQLILIVLAHGQNALKLASQQLNELSPQP
jgi:hypothetical protein